MPDPADADSADTPAGDRAVADPAPLPTLPTLPSPAVVARLLTELPPGPSRRAARAALHTFTGALAARWAHGRQADVLAGARDMLESGVIHIFRMIDSGWRYADHPEAARSLRRALMPDGVGLDLYRPWPEALSWLRALFGAINKPSAAPARGRHLEWMFQHFGGEVDAAADASAALPDGRDVTIIAAGHALEAALTDALEAFIEAGGDIHRLVAAVESGPRPPPHAGRPVEPAAGPAPPEGSAVEIEVD